MLTGIDHVVLATPDPGSAAAALEAALGLRATGGGQHPALGTHNRLVWLGDSYLELIGVSDRSLAGQSWLGVPTAAALDRGGGLATYALACDDLAGTVARLRAAGSSIGGPIPGERVRPDGRAVRWRLAEPAALGPAEPPFLIEHDGTAAEWTPAERAERASAPHPAGGPVRLVRLELPVADVHRTTMRYVRTLGLGFRPSLAGGGARDASVGEQTVRLRRIARSMPAASAAPPGTGPQAAPGPGFPATPSSIPTIVLQLLDGRAGEPVVAELLGCRFVLER